MSRRSDSASASHIIDRIIEGIEPDRLLAPLPDGELARLARTLCREADGPEELEHAVAAFFTIGAADVEKLLGLMRVELLAEARAGGFEHARAFARAEPQIQAMVKALNQVSARQSGLPFHIAAALGKLTLDADFEKEHRALRQMLLAGAVPAPRDSAQAAAFDCPSDVFQRYLPGMWPWKIGFSFQVRMYQRKEDYGCHYRHGPFNGLVLGWVTQSIPTLIAIILQGWGGRIAANYDHFFLKWWFVNAMGLTPWHLMVYLLARRL